MTGFPLSLRHRKNSKTMAIYCLAVVAFFAYSFLAFQSPKKFDSPDETANFVFSHRLATGQAMSIPMSAEFGGLDFTPSRNVWVVDGRIVPASFFGMIGVYGWIGWLFGSAVILFLTPFFSAIAIIAFYFFIRRIWGDYTGWLAAVLVAVHPVFWYYSSRGMFHNAFFVDLVIIALWAFMTAVDTRPSHGQSIIVKKKILFFFSGLALGLALVVRTSEAPWLIALAIGMVLMFRKRKGILLNTLFALLGFIAPIVVMMVTNATIYGNPIATSYNRTIVSEVVGGGSTSIISAITNILFPFGLNLVKAAENAWSFIIIFFWWLSVPMILGIAKTLRNISEPDNKQYIRIYTWIFLAMTIWLVAYYGSWTLHDETNPDAVTIGTSYTRYWLPIFIFGMPFVASALKQIHDWLVFPSPGQLKSRRSFLVDVFISVVMIGFSFGIVVNDPVQGLSEIRQHGMNYRQIADDITSRTPENAVIITGRADKIFFPERIVIFGIENRTAVRHLILLERRVPVFVYISPLDSLSAARQAWKDNGLNLTSEDKLADNGSLYRLEPLSDEPSS